MSISKQNLQDQYYHMVNDTNIVSKTDLQGVITFVNQKFVNISGYSEEELLGQPHNIIRHPESDSAVFKEMWDTIQAKKDWHGTIKNRKKDGSMYVVKSSVYPVLDDNGEIFEYIAIRHDVTEITEINAKVQKLYDYMVSQERDARVKLESGIVNDITNECQILYRPSDVLSGDFYSIYERKDGSIFIYLLDGQGHGVTPALTVFSISSLVNDYVYKLKNLEAFMDALYPVVKNFLGEEEQLSYTMIMISADRKKLSYSSAGMYPFLIKTDEEVMRVKANNTPFMNFSPLPKTETIKLKNWKSLLIYSDGIVEHEIDILNSYTPMNLIENPNLITEAKKKISKQSLEDDVTVLYLENN